MPSAKQKIVVLATGGTIAGTLRRDRNDGSYAAATQPIEQLLTSAQHRLKSLSVESEQVAQIDSKDMSDDVWYVLTQRCAHHLKRDDVAGIVVTHGSDTLEETAWFLQRMLAPSKPIVITASMRPSDATDADGPANLSDAIAAASSPLLHSVVAVLQAQVHSAREVHKAFPQSIDAFRSGAAGPIATVEKSSVRLLRPLPSFDDPLLRGGADWAPPWPRVEVVMSHAGATGATVRALCVDGVAGLVVAATGSGTVHSELEAALIDAQRNGVRVLRSWRAGVVNAISVEPSQLPSAQDLTPQKARVELLVQLIAERLASNATTTNT